MTLVTEIQTDFDSLIGQYGRTIRFTRFEVSGADAGYDDEVVLGSAVISWESGLIQPVRAVRGSINAVLIEQGKVLMNDSVVYINGDINTSGAFRVGLGSPPTEDYFVVDDGITSWPVNGSVVYKKMIVRRLSTGSFVNEG